MSSGIKSAKKVPISNLRNKQNLWKGNQIVSSVVKFDLFGVAPKLQIGIFKIDNSTAFTTVVSDYTFKKFRPA